MKLSGVREDSNVLREIRRVNKAQRKLVDEIASVPLLIYPSNPTDEFLAYTTGLFSTDTQKNMAVVEEALRELPTSFSFLHPQLTFSEQGVEFTLYTTLVNDIDVDNKIRFVVYIVGSEVRVVSAFAGELRMDTGEGICAMSFIKRGSVLTEGEDTAYEDMEGTKAEVVRTMVVSLFNITAMSMWAHEHDKYPVITRSVKRSSSQTPVHKRRDLPRLIYMNKLPSAHKQSLGGHHESPRGHERRGHYKTLRHEKYKHHPKYGVEKGIYVRPAWVGDKSVVHEGNRYTVIT